MGMSLCNVMLAIELPDPPGGQLRESMHRTPPPKEQPVMRSRKNRPVARRLMVPINNTTMERETACLAAGRFALYHAAYSPGKGLLQPETMPAYREGACPAAMFADLDIDCVAYGCTAAGFIAGPAGEAKLATRMPNHRKGCGDDGSVDGFRLQEVRAKEDRSSRPNPDHVNESAHGLSHRCRHSVYGGWTVFG